MKPDTICGRAAVAALFARRPQDALRLFYVTEQRHAAGAWCSVLAAAKRPYRLVTADELERVAGTPHHGGVAAVAKPRPPLPFDAGRPPRTKLLLVLDGIGNPHNLGAIARSAAFFGAGALLLAEREGAAMPSDAAYRTAEGGLEYLEVLRTAALPAALVELQPYFLPVSASLSPHATPLAELPRDRPIALVLGNEEQGVSQQVLSACRRHVHIAGSGNVQSLNVAQAAAVLLHALCG
jgi:TrmH RNA methyltransferase